MTKKAQKQYCKKVAKYKSNVNWKGSRRNDVEAVDQLFGANKVEIKQKMLEALRLLRQADHALNKVREYFDNLTKDVWNWRSTNTKEECKGEIGNVQWWTDKKTRQLSESVI